MARFASPSVRKVAIEKLTDAIAKRIGERIRFTRKSLDFTLFDLEVFSGIASQEISRIERGLRRPRLDIVVRLALGLKANPRKFLPSYQEMAGYVREIGDRMIEAERTNHRLAVLGLETTRRAKRAEEARTYGEE